MKRFVLLIFCVVVLQNVGRAQSPGMLPFDRHPLLIKILEWQDSRRVDSLILALKDSSALVRAKSIYALASVQESTTATVLVPFLSDSLPQIRREAAFAIGQIAYHHNFRGDAETLERALITQWDKEDDAAAKRNIAEALGKCGSQSTIIKFTNSEELRKPTTAKSLIAAVVLAVARIGLKNVMVPTINAFCFEVLRRPTTEKDAEIGFAATYFFARAPIERWRSYADALAIISSAKKFPPEVFINIARALGKTKNPSYLDDLKKIAKSTDWRVRVESARALGALPVTNSTISVLMSLLPDKVAHVRLSVLEQLAKSAPALDEKSLSTLKNTVNQKNLDPRELGQILKVIAGKEPSWVWKNKERFLPEGTMDAHPLLQISMVEAVSLSPELDAFKYVRSKISLMIQLLTQPITTSSATTSAQMQKNERGILLRNGVLVGITALQAIHRIWLQDSKKPNYDSSQTAKHFYLLEQSLNTSDAAVITTSADLLADSAFAPMNVTGVLLQRLSSLYAPRDVEAMQSIIGGLAKLKATEALPVLVPLLQDSVEALAQSAAAAIEEIQQSRPALQGNKPVLRQISPDSLRKTWNNSVFQITTKQGSIIIALDVEEAPLTAMNFYTLAQKGLFNGIPFHRVVSNFVVQGGDIEREDGWGGPGYAIRSEFTHSRFDRGIIGMASAGKDTEGCQYFFMHSYAPHLDGRYTAFAHVVKGMDVVDKLLPFDAVESVTLTTMPKSNK